MIDRLYYSRLHAGYFLKSVRYYTIKMTHFIWKAAYLARDDLLYRKCRDDFRFGLFSIIAPRLS